MVKLSSICLLLALPVLGCGGGGGNSPAANANTDVSAPSGEGVCALLLQGEVDELFGSPAGLGAAESLGDGVELCSWPPGDDPWLMVQVGPAAGDIRQAVALGDGFEVRDISGLPGPAAMAVDVGESGFVAVVAVQAGAKTLTVSPIGLGIPPSGPQFERLVSTISLMTGRL